MAGRQQAIKREVKELSLLFEISQKLGQRLDLRNVAGPVLEALAEHMGMSRGTLTLLNRETGDLFIEAAHGRFPTNTTGWWGGAHPFGLLDWAVVHNSEISSYGINRRYLANFGYHCTLQTDTEVITYLFDPLIRKHSLSTEAACLAMEPPFWSQIERLPADRQKLARALRIVYGGALLNGPFSVVVAHRQGMIGFNDRIKLCPMVAARLEDMLYLASEETAIRTI